MDQTLHDLLYGWFTGVEMRLKVDKSSLKSLYVAKTRKSV